MIEMVSIIILNYRNWQDTIECLNSVFMCSYNNIRIIVVDNDSRNESLDRIHEWLLINRIQSICLTKEQSEKETVNDIPVVLIRSDFNNGYAAGNNIGIRWAIRVNSDFVMILNNDTIVDKNFIEPLICQLKFDKDTMLVGPLIKYPDGTIDKNCARRRPALLDYFYRVGIGRRFFPENKYVIRHYYSGEYDYTETKRIDINSGSCMLFRTRDIIKIGLFDERTFLYLEEFIIHEKLRSHGGRTYIVPNSKIIHKSGKSTDELPRTNLLRFGFVSLQYYINNYRNYPMILIKLMMIDKYIIYLKSLIKHKYYVNK